MYAVINYQDLNLTIINICSHIIKNYVKITRWSTKCECSNCDKNIVLTKYVNCTGHTMCLQQ